MSMTLSIEQIAAEVVRLTELAKTEQWSDDRFASAVRALTSPAGVVDAWVPIHPRQGPLWSMTTDSPSVERLPDYQLRAVCFSDQRTPRIPLPANRNGSVYLAGPMNGIPEWNFPAFAAKAEELRANRLRVVNPAEHEPTEGAARLDYIRFGVARLAQCETIYLLKGWEKSRGARVEKLFADILGLDVQYEIEPPESETSAATDMEAETLYQIALQHDSPAEGWLFEAIRHFQRYASLWESLRKPHVDTQTYQQLDIELDQAKVDFIRHLQQASLFNELPCPASTGANGAS